MVLRKASHSWWRWRLAMRVLSFPSRSFSAANRVSVPWAEVVVGLGLDVADTQGQTRLGALECLELRFLIAAEDHSFLRRIEIEPDYIPELLLKLLVLG